MLKQWIKENKAVATAIAGLLSAVIYALTGMSVEINTDVPDAPTPVTETVSD